MIGFAGYALEFDPADRVVLSVPVIEGHLQHRGQGGACVQNRARLGHLQARMPLGGDQKADIEAAIFDLNSISHRLSELMLEQTAAARDAAAQEKGKKDKEKEKEKKG